MEDCLNRSNLWKLNALSVNVDGEKLGNIKGLSVRLASLELRIARLFLTLRDVAHEILES